MVLPRLGARYELKRDNAGFKVWIVTEGQVVAKVVTNGRIPITDAEGLAERIVAALNSHQNQVLPDEGEWIK